ncbi:MAG: triose-phosphate isomerase [candidate division KSB1 bacterium]|nr:triose-phosphate isomerase [candidate division KSB1 bacterium]MDZ7336055.1 triose-phosphate isomerase [candidate division KSB1 bacterium]MDZ7358057.1 triose-phosphate isomerase [candidate division KSB1 bacterium]MDZ7402240.1 triose-phosphate isomerase [candidate division KSB1 bacterium]
MRKKIIAGNWKMNKTGAEAATFARDLKIKTLNIHKTEIVVCPPFTAIDSVYNILKDSRIKLGAQNVHWEAAGAFTGEVSAGMIEAAGCKYVIIGHSERRQYFGETDVTVNKKIKQTLTTTLSPIVCIGETLDQRQAGQTEAVINHQIRAGLAGLSKEQMERIVLAYEPVWAIGTGVTATPQQAEQVHLFIRQLLTELFDRSIADRTAILYGGSVKPDNIHELLNQPDIDGGLIGGASLKVDSFVEMIKIAETLSN